MKYMPFIALFLVLTACGLTNENNASDQASTQAIPVVNKSTANLDKLSTAYFASGCFWCVEAVYESVRGVEEAVSGYSGGNTPNPTYDPEVVTYETLVKVYYGSHDPTTVNGQRPDFGTQYRSIIFYQNETEKEIAEAFKAKVADEYSKPIATEIVPFEKFWVAEDYHQNFERLNPDHSYVRSVSIPRLRRFQAKFPELLKAEHKN